MGSLLVRFGPNTGSRLFGFLIFYAYPCTVSIALSIIASNVAGFTKKSVATTMAMVGYTTGNIIGPFLFLPKEEPAYPVRFLPSELLIVKGSC
jgi:MFS transporter, ACS family, allantoate permease